MGRDIGFATTCERCQGRSREACCPGTLGIFICDPCRGVALGSEVVQCIAPPEGDLQRGLSQEVLADIDGLLADLWDLSVWSRP